jgi:hypothetical protein
MGKAARRRLGGDRAWGIWPVLALGLLSWGCDSDWFVPSRPAELTRPVAAASPASTPAAPASSVAAPGTGRTAVGARTLELIVGPRSPVQAEMTQNSARLQAGLDKIRIQIAIAGRDPGSGSQAELVRKAVARDPLALVVEPADPADPDLAEAVARARGRGIVVVVAARPLTAPKPEPSKSPGEAQGAGPVIRVVPEGFAISAKALVAAAANNARNAKLALEAGAILAVDTTVDPLVEDRVRALTAALRDAGIRLAHEIRYAGDSDAFEKELDELLERDQKACIVLGADVTSTRSAYTLANRKGEKRPFVVAGYTADESELPATRMGEYAAIAAFSADRLIRKAVATAILAAAGQKFPEQVEISVPVHVSPADSRTPRMYEMKKSGQRRTS